MVKTKTIIWLLALLVLTGCSSAGHGTFVASTFTDSAETGKSAANEFLGEVISESSQTFLFYIFPLGEPPSTNAAILNAKSRYQDTRFLADVSIDDRIYWGLGYSKKTIQVDAKAYK